jgi:NAD(P)-dependent dehydrogenase (short-subunit alcohol dehydrogenase family)
MAGKRTILITGCSAQGIGAVLALTLAKQGHHVFATARDTSKIPSELSSLPNVSVLALDVSSTESVAEASKAVEEAGHGLDVLVNNAGFGYTMPILDVDIDKAQSLYNANVWGTVRTVQAFAAQLIKSKGRVVNVSSVGAVVNTPWIGKRFFILFLFINLIYITFRCICDFYQTCNYASKRLYAK